MKLVLEYDCGDGYTFCCTETLPIEYDSPEALYCDMIDMAKNCKSGWFEFLGENFGPEYFRHGDFQVYTLEEWFDENKIQR